MAWDRPRSHLVRTVDTFLLRSGLQTELMSFPFYLMEHSRQLRKMKAQGPGSFAVAFAPSGVAIVSETGSGAPQSAAISSYSVQASGTLSVVSASVPTLGTANCWNAVTPDGRFVYASNAGTSSLSGFAIGANGALTSISGTVVGLNPAGSTNIDIAVSADGAFLYTLDTAAGAISGFAIDSSTGQLTNLGMVASGLPRAGGLNGIAAD